jgi:hypothetical protein
MKYLKSFALYEARVLDTRYGKDEDPLKDDDTIRVYHGFNYPVNALQAIEYGLSGKEKAKRIYSYEAGNNPKGLFVTVDFDTAKKFSGGIIIEFQCKVSDLEAPVWKDGNYGVQGQFVNSFRDEEEREEARLRKREVESENERDVISKSDRPELAETIFDNPERQALFISDLNPNMIRAIWVNEDRLLRNRITGTYERMNKNEFMKRYGNDIKKKTLATSYGNQSGYDEDYNDAKQKLFNPNDDFDIKVAMDKLNNKYIRKKRYVEKIPLDKDLQWSEQEFIDMLKDDYHALHTFLYPKQIEQVKNGDY